MDAVFSHPLIEASNHANLAAVKAAVKANYQDSIGALVTSFPGLVQEGQERTKALSDLAFGLTAYLAQPSAGAIVVGANSLDGLLSLVADVTKTQYQALVSQGGTPATTTGAAKQVAQQAQWKTLYDRFGQNKDWTIAQALRLSPAALERVKQGFETGVINFNGELNGLKRRDGPKTESYQRKLDVSGTALTIGDDNLSDAKTCVELLEALTAIMLGMAVAGGDAVPSTGPGSGGTKGIVRRGDGNGAMTDVRIHMTLGAAQSVIQRVSAAQHYPNGAIEMKRLIEALQVQLREGLAQNQNADSIIEEWLSRNLYVPPLSALGAPSDAPADDNGGRNNNRGKGTGRNGNGGGGGGGRGQRQRDGGGRDQRGDRSSVHRYSDDRRHGGRGSGRGGQSDRYDRRSRSRDRERDRWGRQSSRSRSRERDDRRGQGGRDRGRQ